MSTIRPKRTGHQAGATAALLAGAVFLVASCSRSGGDTPASNQPAPATQAAQPEPQQQAPLVELRNIPLPVPFPLAVPVPVKVAQMDQEDAYDNVGNDLSYVAHFSILGRCEVTGDIGVATVSNIPTGGGLVVDARAGAGAVIIGAQPNVSWKAQALDLLAQGKSATEAVQGVVTAPETADASRMLGVLDTEGRTNGFIGRYVTGGPQRTQTLRGENCIAMTCEINAWRPISRRMVEAFEKNKDIALAERLLLALRAALMTSVREGGGHERYFRFHDSVSAALLVVRERAGYEGSDRLVDVRVDLSNEPVQRLVRAYRAWCKAFVVPRMPALLKRLTPNTPAYDINRAWADRGRSGTTPPGW